MHSLQKTRIDQAIWPQALVKNGSFTSYVIDTALYEGNDEIAFIISLGATDVATTAVTVNEADAVTNATTLTNGTKVADIAAANLPSATSDNSVLVIHVNLRAARKRYLQLVVTEANGTNGAYLSAIAIGIHHSARADDTAKRGVASVDFM